jgi:antitoxin (DNA-binding transcriptional repressor) of toxin-antitoxin stability system
MEHRISASDLARHLGDVLGRVRYRGEAFLVERHNVAIARITPVTPGGETSVGGAFAAWRAAGPPDPEFADLLEQVGALDSPPDNPWDS